MNQKLQSILIVIAVVLVSAGAITYGALTAEPPKPQAAAPVSEKPKLTKAQLSERLQTEFPTITGVIHAAYPKITTDYTIESPQLFEDGQWFGALLRYRGADTANRDTLRILLQKKDGLWLLRSTPPEPLLSAKRYPDVPRSILKTLNQPVSLP